MEPSVCRTIPAGHKPVYFLIGVLAFMAILRVAVSTLLTITVLGSRNTTFALSPAARVVDFRGEPGLGPKSRRFVSGCPATAPAGSGSLTVRRRWSI